MFYTLSLPVTRGRLFRVRVLLGLAEMAGIQILACCADWLGHPIFRHEIAPVEMFEHSFVAFFWAVSVYSLGVLFATFLMTCIRHGLPLPR
jgi:hypothetical protein